MKAESTPLAGVTLITPTVHGDTRGFFLETWHAERYANLGISLPFVQDNHSRSAQGILRGLHLQTEKSQGKLVRVTAGAVFDVVVDCQGRVSQLRPMARGHTDRDWTRAALDPPRVRARFLCADGIRRFCLQVHRLLPPRKRTLAGMG